MRILPALILAAATLPALAAPKPGKSPRAHVPACNPAILTGEAVGMYTRWVEPTTPQAAEDRWNADRFRCRPDGTCLGYYSANGQAVKVVGTIGAFDGNPSLVVISAGVSMEGERTVQQFMFTVPGNLWCRQ